MAIKLVDLKKDGDGYIGTFFADTKAEVPASDVLTGLEAVCKDIGGDLTAGTMVYTAALEVGIVDSTGAITWN